MRDVDAVRDRLSAIIEPPADAEATG